MVEKPILPEEIRLIIQKISVNNSDGPEGEGGIYAVEEIEQALSRDGRITSDFFGVDYPRLSYDVKISIAISFLYSLALEKLETYGIRLEMPHFDTGPDGIRAIAIDRHLENLTNIWWLSEAPNYGHLLREYQNSKKQIQEIWATIPIDLQMLIYGDDAMFLNREQATEWILTPHPLLDDKSPAEIIANGEIEKIKAMINDYRTGLPL